MKHLVVIVVAIAILVAVGLFFRYRSRSSPPPPAPSADIPHDQLPYRGERIKLSRAYDDFERYQQDDDNLPPESVERVARLITDAKVNDRYPDRDAVQRELTELRFPGYGLAHFDESKTPDGSTLVTFAVELPRNGKSRFLAFRELADGSLVLVDDWISPELGVTAVAEEAGQIVYRDAAGTTLATRPTRPVK